MANELSLAIGTNRLTADHPRLAEPVSVPWSYPAEAEELESALTAAFGALSTKLAQAIGRPLNGVLARVVLLPPLAQTRVVQLPPLKKAEAQLVLQRDASRYFPGGTGPRALAVRVPGASKDHSTLAVAASAALIENIRVAAATNGWRVGQVVPASAAWEAAAASLKNQKFGALVAVIDETAHVFTMNGGRITNVRRVSAQASDIASAVGGATATALLADKDERETLRTELKAAGLEVTALELDPASAATAHSKGSDLQLVTPSLMQMHSARRQTHALAWAAAAMILVIGAAAVELWGWQRELVGVRQQRADIRTKVVPLLAARDSLNLLQQRHLQIEGVAAQAPKLTPALFDLAMVLPSETHIKSLRANGDTLIVEAEGGRAGDAIEALSSAPNLRDVKVRGTVDRELEDGSMAGERFTLMARLATTVGPDSVAAAKTTSKTRPSTQVAQRKRGEL
jgi:hypothetical protein